MQYPKMGSGFTLGKGSWIGPANLEELTVLQHRLL
jgi:hypothetical protein